MSNVLRLCFANEQQALDTLNQLSDVSLSDPVRVYNVIKDAVFDNENEKIIEPEIISDDVLFDLLVVDDYVVSADIAAHIVTPKSPDHEFSSWDFVRV